MPKGNIVWGLEAYRDFVKATFQVGGLSVEQKERITDKMVQMGHAVTYEALRQHVQKMNRNDKAAGSSNASTDTAAPGAANTAGISSSGTDARHSAKLRPAGAGRRLPRRNAQKRVAPVYNDGEDDDEDQPRKRLARIKKEETSVNLGQMEDDEPKPPTNDKEYWSESDRLQSSTPVNNLASVVNDGFDAEATPI
ncbi:hypothetical protein F5Y06DRAFT_200612 [Hypoxylon sp. FL0890]|nr:hypothetical protein F5Y06DRAFT_200612 [Hypoxylon sp. FL0890]